MKTPRNYTLRLRSQLAASAARELLLAAQCLELKNTVDAHEERGRHDAAKIADLLRRNATLTAALHRTACAG